jgi:hypothetical protein
MAGGGGGGVHLPALQESPEAHVLPHEPQLFTSAWRSRQVSGVVPQRKEVGAEQGHVVAVTRAVSVSVDVGARVRVVAGTVREMVSVSSVIVVTSIAWVVYTTSVKVVVVVESWVAEARPRQPQAAEMVSQRYPLRRAVGAVSQDGSGVGAGVTIGVVDSVDTVEVLTIEVVDSINTVERLWDGLRAPVAWGRVELAETWGCQSLETADRLWDELRAPLGWWIEAFPEACGYLTWLEMVDWVM